MIDLTQLPADGLRLDGSLGALPMGDGNALRGVNWRLLVMPSGPDFFMEIKGDAVWEGACSRCLEPLDLPLTVESQFLGSKDPDLVVRGAQLQAPMHPLCREACEGLCPECGKNLNKGRCTCRLELRKGPGVLAKALVGLKLNLKDADLGAESGPDA